MERKGSIDEIKEMAIKTAKKELEKLSIVKQYGFLDPVYRRAAKQLY